MIRLMKLILVVGLLWSAYWYTTGFTVRRGLEAWFATQATRGWQAEFADVSTSGYPFRHNTMLTKPALADPANGTAWRADWLLLDSPAIWPGSLTVSFPDTPQRLSYFDQTVVLMAQEMTALLHLHPGFALELQDMALTSGSWQFADDSGPIIGAKTLNLAMVQGDDPATYTIDVAAGELTPGEFMRQVADVGAPLPHSFDTLALNMTVQFDQPWDRSALEKMRPQPVSVDLKLAEAKWGALSLFAAGKVSVDGNGIPVGEVTLKAENWRDMLAVAQASGFIPDLALEPTVQVLNMMSGVTGNPNALDVELKLRDGLIYLGPIPLGQAPRLLLH